MRYISLAQALVIAEAVTGVDRVVLARGAGIGLLDSALHAPASTFAGHELYPDFIDKRQPCSRAGRAGRPQPSAP